ncbi:LOW QUALITY PROTEIN: inactive ubiquitin carboxyl-terminal hydrolase MINDY-4B [Pyrgilauda ruficollis]|uniref:LOW QUALITY PROTEIN: inactive ubiquitin carboxyl-terminal hydrolase MINDY-4B n=1 Tax=Pyrgilauda ruficollis TaxID=221976 RepID=UPI001B879B11|nr:LOW QUALITY PROTEIN: inactive ubiquitin carboxyl-terminal hydrolase MINDY-4B [Pyrgilauda ruficollis]
MGEPGAGHAEPASLEEIASRISDLSKWREIFSFRGLEINSTTHQQGRSGAGQGPPGAGECPGPQPPSTVPQPLLLPPGTGGRPISPDTAMRLQELLFRNTAPVFSCEWAAAHFRFHQPHSDLAYALQAGKGGTRAILAAVQAHVITYLLFTRETECTHLERLCRVGRWEQGQALATALAETLWAAGGGGRAVVCLVTAPITTMPREGYRANSFTERIRLFEFSEKAAVQGFISDHINCFKGEGSHGVILFLYSLLFSRTLERVQEDLGDTAPLLNISSGNVTCTEAVLSLLLTGRASAAARRRPGAGARRWARGWRGAVAAGPRGLPALGAGAAGAAGERGDSPGQRDPRHGPGSWQASPAQVSPGLRTPRLPVWLCSLSGRHSVLFGTDSRLLSDWKSERLFHLYFYSGQQEQTQTAHLTIDTHSHHWEEAQREGPCSPGKRRPALEMAIRTKWAGATVSWNGTDPFF